MSIAVVIPAYRARSSILQVLQSIPQQVSNIYLVDDCCPQQTGQFASISSTDRRLITLFNSSNQGVGAAVLKGYVRAYSDGHDIVVKVDADGQCPTHLISHIVEPLLNSSADYVKGNRFYFLSSLAHMPPIRLLGNTFLSFLSKASTGYWNIMDPTNGFTAINANLIPYIYNSNLARRFFFESDLLHQLYLQRAVVVDLPHYPIYNNEISNLNPIRVTVPFLVQNIRNIFRRLIITYFVRDFNPASLLLFFAILLLPAGIITTAASWSLSISSGVVRTAGTVVISSTLLIIGFFSLFSFLSFDLTNIPRQSVSRHLFHRFPIQDIS